MRSSSLAALTFLAGLAWTVNASAQPPAASGAPADAAQPPAQPDTPPAPPIAPPSEPPPSEVPPAPPPIVDPAPQIPEPPLTGNPTPFVPALPPSFSGPSADAETRPMDLMLPFSLTSLALGGVMMLTGGITMGASGPGEYCGITGCVDRPDPLASNIGASLIGAGVGFATVGAFGFLGWATNRPGPGMHRKNEPMAMSGMVITSLSAASLGLAFGQMTTYSPGEIDLTSAWPFLVTSGVLAGVGIPLLAVGSKNKPDKEPTPEVKRPDPRYVPGNVPPVVPLDFPVDPAAKRQMRSEPMMITGGVLIGMGGLHAIAGTGVIIADATTGVMGGFGAFIIGMPLLVDSLILTSIGIPLLAVGSSTDRRGDAALSPLIPTVSAGAGGLRTTWSLE